jgi:glycosyltransferase involved in cell wall biosynthesis
MKILFIGPIPPPLGGVAVINMSIQSINFENHKIISFNTASNIEREDLYSGLKIKSITRNIKIIKKLKKFIELEQPDLINIFITSGLSIFRDILFLKILSDFRIPIIIHFHSKISGEISLTPFRLKIVAKYFKKYANHIILLSNFHLYHFQKYFGNEICSVIENFVNYSDFDNEIGNKNDDFLFVGRLSKEKGFFDLLEAVKILKQLNYFCRINVIGVAPNIQIEKDIEKEINENNLKNYFIMHGATIGDKKNRLFKKSSCLIFPSHFENSPVVIKEAIAAKMAILASNISANENILNSHENNIYFESGNSSDLAQKIIYLIDNSLLVRKMCQDSSTIINYDISIAKIKYLELFKTFQNGK